MPSTQPFNYPNISLVDLFLQRVQQNPNGICLQNNRLKMTYRQVDHYSDHIRDGLTSLGFKRGDHIGILLPNLPQFVLAFIAISKLGGAVVALNPSYPSRELKFHLNDANVKAIFALDTHSELLLSIKSETPIQKIILTSLDEIIRSTEPDTIVLTGQERRIAEVIRFKNLMSIAGKAITQIKVSPDHPAILQYSGGTTGTPKAVVGSHRNIVANVHQFSLWLDELSTPDNGILTAIPLFHVYGMVLGMLLAIQNGSPMILVESAGDIKSIFTAIRKYKPAIFPCVPSLFTALLRSPLLKEHEGDLKCLKVCISGSASLPYQVKSDFEKLISGPLLEGYGLSEAPTATHCNPLHGVNKTGSIGLPLPGVTCKLVDLRDPTVEATNDGEGELVIRGPQVMKGYLNQPSETSATVKDDWLYTGDVAVRDEDGYYFIKGRKKDLIKVGGLQVWPQEIEEVILLHPMVKECAVAGVPDDLMGEAPIAWVVLKEDEPGFIDEIRELCQVNLARYKVPWKIILIEGLPRSAVGKVLRRVLSEEFIIREAS